MVCESARAFLAFLAFMVFRRTFAPLLCILRLFGIGPVDVVAAKEEGGCFVVGAMAMVSIPRPSGGSGGMSALAQYASRFGAADG